MSNADSLVYKPVSIKEFVEDKNEFVNVDIDEFFDFEPSPTDENGFSTDIVILSPEEKELVNTCFAKIKKISPETLEGLMKLLSDLERLGAAIARYPSLLKRQILSSEITTQHTIAESLLMPKDGDKTLHLPTKAILGKGFIVAKYQFFASLSKIVNQSALEENLTEKVRDASLNLMFTIMAEDVYLNLLEDWTIPLEIRREISYSLVILWEHRADQNVSHIAPILKAAWYARRKLAPAFGTMVGTSELLLLTIEQDENWAKFISSRLSDTAVSNAMEEFLFGLPYEQIQALKAIIREGKTNAISRDEAERYLGIKIETYYESDPRSFFLQYSIRRDNAKARRRMNLAGPHGTLEDYYMAFILTKNKEKQQNDTFAN